MKKLLMLQIVWLQLFIAPHSLADDSFYLGVVPGVAFYDTGISNKTGTTSVDDFDNSSTIQLGVNVGSGFIVEFYYADLGNVSISGNAGDSFSQKGTTTTFTSDNTKFLYQYTGYGINALYKVGLGPTALYAKAGILHWSMKYEASVSGTNFATGNDSGNSPLVGIGFEAPIIFPFTSLRIEYAKTKIDDVDVLLVSAGVVVTF